MAAWNFRRIAGPALLAVALGLAGQATLAAGPIEAAMLAQLRADGYSDVRVEYTWLGRIRIIAHIDGRLREIILHPTSGEVLRDYLQPEVTYLADKGRDGGQSTGRPEDDPMPGPPPLGLEDETTAPAPEPEPGNTAP